MAKTQILDYYIHVRDQVYAEQLTAFLRAGDTDAWPNGVGGLLFVPRADGPDTVNFPIVGVKGEWCIRRAPYTAGPPEGGAAVEFAVNNNAYPPAFPLVEVGEAIPATGAGYLSSPWFTNSNDFPRNAAKFTRSTGWWIFGSDTTFYWAGHVVYDPAAAGAGTEGSEPTEPAPIRPRRWIDGIETPEEGEGATDTTNDFSRVASRSIEGYGLAWRDNSSQVQLRTHTLSPAADRHWDRVYVRAPLAFPDAATAIYRSAGSINSAAGMLIEVTASGQLAFYRVDTTANKTLLLVAGQLVLNTWARLDLLHSSVGGTFTLDVYLNGSLIAAGLTNALNPGLVLLITLGRASITGVGMTSVLIDFDDWIGGLPPYLLDPLLTAWSSITAYVGGEIVRWTNGGTYRAREASTNLPPVTNPTKWMRLSHATDWLNGSHVALIRPTGFNGAHSGWTGSFQHLTQRAAAGLTLGLTTSTALAMVSVDTDYVAQLENAPGAIGWAGFNVAFFGSTAAAPDGRLGYKVGAAAAVLTTIVQGVGMEWHNVLYVDPAPLGDIAQPYKNLAIELRHEKANDVAAAVASILHGCVELVGVFGAEDVTAAVPPANPPAAPPPTFRGYHTAPYPRSPWGTGQRPFGPVVIKGGTYMGNGTTGQDLVFAAAPIWIFIRPVTGDTGGTKWWSSMLAAHISHDQSVNVSGLMDATQDFSFVSGGPASDQQLQFLVRIGSLSTQANASGVTYQYIAFCDPAARFSRAGVFALGQSQGPRTVPLDDLAFTPEWLFLFKEDLGTTTTDTLICKGPGHATDALSLATTGTPVSNALDFGAGSLVARAGLLTAQFADYPYIAFRRADGNNAAGQAGVMAMGSYVGDGAASRTVSIAPASGLRPMFGFVQPHNAIAIVRDPSHTTINSSTVNGTNQTTGITAGSVDGFTVGVTLNANGITYTWFVLFGSATAGNGGWSINVELVPVSSDSSKPADWAEPIEADAPVAPVTPVVDPGDLTTDIAAACVSASTRLVNIALSRIGITARLSDLGTDPSQEADAARTVYKTEIDATLRGYPWPFAKRHQALVLVAGTSTVPVNGDWQYSYRAPTSSVLVRRVVDPSLKRGFTKTPIPFEMSADDTGDLVFCDEPVIYLPIAVPATSVTVEYTHRVECPASRGDAIFRSAAAWRLAAALAKPLGRDAKDADRCLRNYLVEIETAKVVHAREKEEQDTQGGDASWIDAR
jgi:hypothetical protein